MITAHHHSPVAERSEGASVQQHRLLTSVLLHLFPGAALLAFVILAAPVLEPFGIPAPFALFIGIPVVIVPLELGVLLIHAKRTTGSFSLRGTRTYDRQLPARKLAAWGAGLAGWFLVFFLASTMLLDEWLAANVFGWLPDAVLQFSTFDGDGPTPGPVLTLALVAVALVFNGVVGPLVEERYFRGYLLPRIERYGRWSPLLNTTLFSLYHLWTPWQNPARIVGFLPIAWAARRFRSVQVAMVAHVTVNLLFLLLMFAAILSGAS